MTTFGIGVVGTGDISDVYLTNLRRHGDIVRVVGCAGRDAAKARRKAEQHCLPRSFADAGELLDDPDVDIVLDLTTPDAHADINLAALRAGKHVYSEKPIAATFAEARELIAVAAALGLRVGCAPDTFMGGRLQTCRALIDQGRLGDIVGAAAFVVSPGHEWHHPNPGFFYAPGGGPILDIAPYYVTALLALLGPVDACAALASRAFPVRTVQGGPQRGEAIEVAVDTHVTGILRFASGALGTLVASFDVWDSELPRLELWGTRGVLCIPDVDPLSGPNLFGGPILLRDAAQSRWRGVPRRDPPSAWTEVEIRHPFTSTSHADNSRGIGLVDMAYAIRDGRSVRASGELALHATEVMESLLASARDGRFVTLTTTCERPAPLPVDYPAGERRVPA
ncbi:MAG TPA: Gfo/Idh/MocA family oxidoreductase [Patescibacteria group bacterium]|nr:Gfo/Idh/MocA family oxidoreductase [Patescibacteria group bacterium]